MKNKKLKIKKVKRQENKKIKQKLENIVITTQIFTDTLNGIQFF